MRALIFIFFFMKLKIKRELVLFLNKIVVVSWTHNDFFFFLMPNYEFHYKKIKNKSKKSALQVGVELYLSMGGRIYKKKFPIYIYLQFFKILDHKINSWPLQKIRAGPSKKGIEPL